MRVSPRTMALLYFALSILFIFGAIQYAEETVWNFLTIFLAFIATLDIMAGIRYLRFHYKLKKLK
ncbi:YdiK family protein [Ornithinibacillus scapharcae]|uniref:YdiK family protein n=1 Tax=Ornithinibacillus scapharcae TaxID=1147159 RepID=UPI000225BC14|nr:YdiK family protein [Ornithinibacillus scapharcae]